MASNSQQNESAREEVATPQGDRSLRAPAAAEESTEHPAVRFASRNQEIEPVQSLQTTSTAATEESIPEQEISPAPREEIRSISRGLHTSPLQQRRMSNFAFEPVSLPVSRVPSNDSGRERHSQEATMSGRGTPKLSPTHSPAVGLDGKRVLSGIEHIAPLTPLQPKYDAEDSRRPNTTDAVPPTTSDEIPTRPPTRSQGSSGPETLPKSGGFSVGRSEDSSLPSQEQSPSQTPGGGSGTATPPTSYSRPFTPVGDKDDPYARNKRPPQSMNLDAIDNRFKFEGLQDRRRSAYVSTATSSSILPRSGSGTDLKSQNRPQSFFGGKRDSQVQLHDDSGHGGNSLKRFFGLGHHKGKRAQSPAPKRSDKAGTMTPTQQAPRANVPFAEDHGLQNRYGKFGRVLGSGAGGSVRIIKRSQDGVTFAVKQFRAKHDFESQRGYSKKVTAEFCIGSSCHHGNVIETMDLIQEKGRWYVIMEYAPYDLFAATMSGKMSKDEVTCSFLQIVSGVSYLHSCGIAHRDLKLDNVVVNENGILKIIDFGSATVFRYPMENDIVQASGVVGSDPYLAPEVYDSEKYDPRPTDIWSLAIVYACMTLRRFPWKAPRSTDLSYKLFAATPTPGSIPPDMVSLEGRSKSETRSATGSDDPRRSSAPEIPGSSATDSTQHRHQHHHKDQAAGSESHTTSVNPPGPRIDAPAKETLKGPWRLLRILPRESRFIIRSMLQLDPMARATLEQVQADSWIAGTPRCEQVEGGRIIIAEGHTHTLAHSENKSSEKQ